MLTKKEIDKIKLLSSNIAVAAVNASWAGRQNAQDAKFFRQELKEAKSRLRNYLKTLQE